MSHTSKIDEIMEAKKLGYKVYLYFICLDEPRLNVSRVKNRVLKGGHNVDTEKILTRYSNTLKNLYSALKLVDRAYLFDNSDEMIMIAEKDGETLRINIDEHNFPNWFIEYVLQKI